MRDHGALPQNLNWAVKMEYATPLFDLPSGPSQPGAGPDAAGGGGAGGVCIVLVGPYDSARG
jgi:hypothetical protein